MLQNLLYFDQKKTHECLGLPMSSKKVKVSRNEKKTMAEFTCLTYRSVNNFTDDWKVTDP